MQLAAFNKQEEVRRNMCANYLFVSDTDTVKEHASEPEHVVHEVAPREQDSLFATSLAKLVAVETETLATRLLGKQNVVLRKSHFNAHCYC